MSLVICKNFSNIDWYSTAAKGVAGVVHSYGTLFCATDLVERAYVTKGSLQKMSICTVLKPFLFVPPDL